MESGEPSQPVPASLNLRKAVVGSLQVAFALAIAWFGGTTIATAWRAAETSSPHVDWMGALFAIPAFALGYVGNMSQSRATLQALGFGPSWATIVRLWSIPQAASYVPGKIWWLLTRYREVRRAGGSVGVAAGDVYVEYCTTMIGAVLVGCLAFTGASREGGWKLAGACAVLAGVSLTLLLPRVSRIVFRRVTGPLGVAGEAPRLPAGTALLILGFVAMTWLSWGSAFGLLVRAISPSISLAMVPQLAGAYTLAWLSGVLSMLPGGLIAREGMLVYLLAGVVGAKEIVVAAAVMRAATVGADMLLAAFSAAFIRKRQSASSP